MPHLAPQPEAHDAMNKSDASMRDETSASAQEDTPLLGHQDTTTSDSHEDASPPASKSAYADPRLPKQQLLILAICRFAEPLANTSLNPYLPEMIKSFNVSSEEVYTWVGIYATAFSICQAVMGIPWGRASDRFGRKPTILFGLTVTMLMSLLWGFSTTPEMAVVARAITGAGNGNVGIIRTTVAEMVPYKELQPLAFSIMPMVWNLGSIFGPSIGGALANPYRVKPGAPRVGNLLQQYPYALPNIVSAVFFLISIITGTLFLRETLETKKGKVDYGVRFGNWITGSCNGKRSKSDEETPLIGSSTQNARKLAPPPWRDVLNRQAILNLLVYFFLAMHTMAYDNLLPALMSAEGKEYSNILKYFGGFGLTSFDIGLLNTCYGIFSMVVQFLLFPQIARRFGVHNCLKVVVFGFPIAYFLTPFTLLLPNQASQVAACFAVQLLKGTCAIFAFPCSTIMLTNSASSMRVLGTLNGFVTTVSAIGRGLGPALVGAIYTEGAKTGYLIAPWWFLAAIGVLSAVPVFALIEGPGFADDAEVAEAGAEGEAEASGQPETGLTNGSRSS